MSEQFILCNANDDESEDGDGGHGDIIMAFTQFQIIIQGWFSVFSS